MNRIWCIYLAAGLLMQCEMLSAQPRLEFNGPFASWADVRRQFGARGNGKDDDTHAFQMALDSLSCRVTGTNMGKSAYTVIYVPAGTYCISSTLQLRGKIGVSIIGEDPARTTIRWIGAAKDTMLWADGSSYFKISRLTWDANGRANMEGIGIHWKNKWNLPGTRSFAPLNIELSDDNFTGGFMYGISGGTYQGGDGTGANDSEVAIRRCMFSGCTEAAIEIKGFNALDYWIWDCKFTECLTAIHCSHGGYHAYRCLFLNSKALDLHNNNGYYNSVRGCYSENARAFSVDDAMSSNPFKRIFQDNTVVNPKLLPIEYYHLGKITLFGNRFSATVDTTFKFSVNTKSWARGVYEVLSLHNTYGYKDPIRIASGPAKLYSVGDRQGVVTPGAAAFSRTMEVTPLKTARRVFEVPRGADAGAIQSIIDRAAGLKGQRPIVHFAMGIYTIDRTLVVPAGSDMQLMGDGLIYASLILKKEGAVFGRGGPMILVRGPSYISIQDLQLGTDGVKEEGPSILFEGVDQAGAQAHLDLVYSHADTSIILRDLDNLYVQKDNSFFTDGNYVSGGLKVQKGSGTAGLYCYGGQFEHVRVERNGKFLAKDCWWEGETRVPLDLQGSGRICIDGAMIAPNHPDSGTTINIGRFSGHISLMNMYVQGALSPAADNPELSLFVWNVNFYHKMSVLDFLGRRNSFKGAFIGCNAQCFDQRNPSCKEIASIEDKWVNVPDVNAFIDQETSFDRDSRPVLYRQLPKGASNIYVSRISMLGSGRNGLIFTSQ